MMKTTTELQGLLEAQSSIDKPVLLEDHLYRIKIDSKEICIGEPIGEVSRTYFKAEYNEGLQSILFSIHTRDTNGLPVPGLYASELFRLAVSYFESHFPVQQINALWIEGSSDNYAQYQYGLNLGMSFEQAAVRTWTGKLAAKLGFTLPILINVNTYPASQGAKTQTCKVLSLKFVKSMSRNI